MFDASKRRCYCGAKNAQKGFSLIELMITVSIAAILSAIAAPSLSSWVDSSRAKSVRQQLYGLGSMARSYALKESQTMTICHLEANKCDPDIGLPLTLFTDNNRNAELDSDEQTVRVFNVELPEKISLSWNRSGYMRFWPSGGTGALTGSLSYCDELNFEHDFRLVVARTGRLRIDESETRCN